MFGSPILMGSSGLRTLIISGQEVDLNVHESFGSPADQQRVVVIIKPGGVVTGFSTGPFAEGSVVKLYNYGYILGHGGNGGSGAGIGQVTAGDGEQGGSAITLETDIDIYMQLGSGYIWSGGGGGGGGGWAVVSSAVVGGGGGGGGVSGGLGGLGGASTGGFRAASGEDATTGISAVPGAGADTTEGDGGDGGSWNESGQVGTGDNSPGAGGNAGWAIETNGYNAVFTNISYALLTGVQQIKGSIN